MLQSTSTPTFSSPFTFFLKRGNASHPTKTPYWSLTSIDPHPPTSTLPFPSLPTIRILSTPLHCSYIYTCQLNIDEKKTVFTYIPEVYKCRSFYHQMIFSLIYCEHNQINLASPTLYILEIRYRLTYKIIWKIYKQCY